jgi:hypothetical protein
MKINWDDVFTNLVKYGAIGIFALGLHLITKNAIEGHQNQERRIVQLENHHIEDELEKKEEPEPSFLGKTWNWITLKEFRE